MRLARDFYTHDTLTVARMLLGKRLVRRLNGHRLSGRIVEAEAYIGQEDRACHASAGRTARTEVMYGPPGRAYVYFTYGMHWMLNVVTGAAGEPAAVLIRALEPLEGLSWMKQNRERSLPGDLCSGPARLTQALRIDRAHNGLDLCGRGAEVWIEDALPVPQDEVAASPRIGLGSTPEPWLSMPWRLYIRDNPFVSRRSRSRPAP